jgi:CheY-like chemotaxis protein
MPTPQTILLVEDSEDDAFLFKRMFDRGGTNFRLHHARNGAEAIEFLRAASNAGALPRIVLLDLKLPVLNGFEVLDWVREQIFSSQAPVVVLSGSDQQQDKESALRLGAVDYIVKPMTLPELRRILEETSSWPASAHRVETGSPR